MAPQVTAQRLRFRLPLDPARLLRARQRLRDYLRQHHVELGVIDDAILVIEEAMTNAVRHSGADHLELELSFAGDDLIMTVRDHGRGFDVSRFDPQTQPDLYKPSGRGLYLMAHLADQLTLHVDDGLEVRAVKRNALRAGQGAEATPAEARDRAQRDAREQSLIDEIDEDMFALDWEYRFRQANDATVRSLGHPREYLLGQTIWDVLPQARAAAADALLHQAMELGRSSSLEYFSLIRNRWLEMRAYATSSGIIVYVRDVHARKLKELERDELLAALRTSEERYRNLIETTGEGVLIGRPDGKIIYVNQRMADMLGYTAAELLDTSGLDLVFADWLPNVMENRAALSSGNVVRGEIQLRRKDGTPVWTMWSSSPMFNEAGEHVANLTMHGDISERKRAEDELQTLYESQRDIAVTLQQSFRHTVPQLAHMEVGLVESPAATPGLVGGDLWDLVQLAGGHVLALIGDVSGKGIPAAGRTWTVRSAVNALARVSPEPGFILDKTNELLLHTETEEGQFVTALVLVIEPAGGLALASAGHPAPVLVSRAGGRLLEPTYGPPLGTLPAGYESAAFTMDAGDYVVLYTDGVTEARHHGELYGEQRLLRSLQGLYGRAAQEIAEAVRAGASAFADELQDDLAVLVIRRLPEPAPA